LWQTIQGRKVPEDDRSFRMAQSQENDTVNIIGVWQVRRWIDCSAQEDDSRAEHSSRSISQVMQDRVCGKHHSSQVHEQVSNKDQKRLK